MTDTVDVKNKLQGGEKMGKKFFYKKLKRTKFKQTLP